MDLEWCVLKAPQETVIVSDVKFVAKFVYLAYTPIIFNNGLF